MNGQLTNVICNFTSSGHILFFFISNIYNFRETAGCSVPLGLYPKFHEAIIFNHTQIYVLFFKYLHYLNAFLLLVEVFYGSLTTILVFPGKKDL